MKKKTLIILFLKKNIFSMICLLLSFFILVMGTVSYSKYINSNSSSSNSTVGSFAVSASVDSVSGLSFTNTEFWSSLTGDEDDKIAMNVLRNLNFSVNNFKTDENGKTQVSDVKLKYNLSFSAPMIFAKKLAFQVLDEYNNAVIPQIVISDLLSKVGSSYSTSESIDYHATDAKDLEFTVTGDNLYEAKSSDGVIITIEKYTDTVDQSLLFRMWDTSSLTNENNKELEVEGGKIMPPIEIDFETEVDFYRITIIKDTFVLPAGEDETHKYTIKLVTTSTISDIHLGATIVDAITDSNNDTVGYNKIKEISNGNKYLQSIKESYIISDNLEYTKDVSNESEKEIGETVITGSVNLYKDGNESKNVSSPIVETFSDKNIEINKIEKIEEINWNEYVSNDDITSKNYKEKAVAKGVDANNNLYYICKLNVKRTGKQKINFINEQYNILSYATDTITMQTDVIETSNVKRLDGEEEIILLDITKKTEIKLSGYFGYELTVITNKQERTYTQEGFIYRAFYLNGENLDYYKGNEPLLEVADDISLIKTNKKYYLERINVETENVEITTKEITTNNKSENKSQQILSLSNIVYKQKKIIRNYERNSITINKIKWSELTDNGLVSVEENNISLYDENDKQIYWLAQSYSKNYPFYVDVVFEQTQ